MREQGKLRPPRWKVIRENIRIQNSDWTLGKGRRDLLATGWNQAQALTILAQVPLGQTREHPSDRKKVRLIQSGERKVENEWGNPFKNLIYEYIV